ncbi:MAG: hypothetical protein ACYC0F_08780 [Rhodanobacter sp.]
MSDFLDRMAARAIGGETPLAPRLPSLFEPLQRAPVMPPVDEGEMPARGRDAGATTPVAQTAAPSPRSPAHARESMEPRAARIAPAERPALPTPARAAADAPRAPVPPSPQAASPVRAIVADRAIAPPTPERPVTAASPVSPRQSHVAPSRQKAVPMPAPSGVLLPAPAPVFAATGAVPGRSERTVAARAAAARAESRAAAATGESVVHVSIGRLEVRAAPATAAPPRRREGPPPASLDDYLRQRGKGSP